MRGMTAIGDEKKNIVSKKNFLKKMTVKMNEV